MARTRRSVIRALAAAGLAAALPPALAQAPKRYAGNYGRIVAAANAEGRVVIWGATDARAAAPLLQDFQSIYPGVQPVYHDVASNDAYQRMSAEGGAEPVGDVIWSSAMDLQIKLVNDGHAQPYASPEAPNLPPWAVWRNEAFGTTVEPVVFAYNKRLLDPQRVPDSHAALRQLLLADGQRLRGRIATYDPERSGLGFLLMTQDVNVSAQGFWGLARALAGAGVRGFESSAEMVGRIAAGDCVLGYNLLGTYAAVQAKRDPNIGIVLPRDYTLVISRIVFIARRAQNPNAARLWLDYLLSRRGQEVIAGKADLYAIRGDVAGPATAQALERQLGQALKPVSVGPGLLTYLDQSKRHEFLRRWRETLGGEP